MDRVLARRLAEVRRLPPRVAVFHARALLLAARLGDDFTLRSVTQPADVRTLLGLARGRERIVELGTAAGWTAGALALTGARVLSLDPVVVPQRARYLALLPRATRERITCVQAPGVEGVAHAGGPVDLLFVDSTHERAATVAEVQAWRPALAPDALIVLHDFANPAFPGVTEAVCDLGLDGDVRGGMLVARA